NGTVDSSVTISVAHNGAGDYTATTTLPLTYTGGDNLELLVSATIGGIAAKEILAMGPLDRTPQIVANEIATTPATLASSQKFHNPRPHHAAADAHRFCRPEFGDAGLPRRHRPRRQRRRLHRAQRRQRGRGWFGFTHGFAA